MPSNKGYLRTIDWHHAQEIKNDDHCNLHRVLVVANADLVVDDSFVYVFFRPHAMPNVRSSDLTVVVDAVPLLSVGSFGVLYPAAKDKRQCLPGRSH